MGQGDLPHFFAPNAHPESSLAQRRTGARPPVPCLKRCFVWRTLRQGH